MRRYTNQRRRRSTHTYSEGQLAGLHASTTARKQEIVERLRAAIASLKEKKQAIMAQSIYVECGLHYSSYVRNEQAIALFRANSTYLTEQKQRTKRRRKISGDASLPPSPRDLLLKYKKPQLVMRLREAQQRIQDLERQLATLADACLQRDAQVVELEAKLTELEPYRTFVEQVVAECDKKSMETMAAHHMVGEYSNHTPLSASASPAWSCGRNRREVRHQVDRRKYAALRQKAHMECED